CLTCRSTTRLYTLSRLDALPISATRPRSRSSPTSPAAWPQPSRCRHRPPPRRRPMRCRRRCPPASPTEDMDMPECIVAEDEELLRASLVLQLGEAWPELRVVAECEDGAGALEAIATHQPDVAFLDIRMPGLTGIQVAAAMAQSSPRTQVVFVTAYDQYAIEAFEKGAVDYLLKPVARERLQATVQRLQARAAGGGPDQATLDALLQHLARRPPAPSAPPPLAWITASNGRETKLIMLEDVAYFRADSKYTVVVTAEGES